MEWCFMDEKNFNIMGVHSKFSGEGGGSQKTNIKGRNCLKSGGLDSLQI